MKRSSLAGPRLVMALIAVLAHASVAAADQIEPISVTSQDCTFDAAELERLVKLELSSVLDKQTDAQYRVELRCAAQEITITIHDPLTSKTLERSVRPPPSSQPEPERLLALTVAQLYRAAWLELAADVKAPLPPSHPAPRSERSVAAARAAAQKTLAAPSISIPNKPKEELTHPHDKYSWSVGAGAGIRARHVERPILLRNLELDGTFAPVGPLFWVIATGGAEWTSLPRSSGTVGVLLARGATGIGVEPFHAGAFSGFGELLGGVTYAHISGRDPVKGFNAGHVAGAGFDGSLALGVRARANIVRVELLGRAGILAGTPAGRVTNERDVSCDGPWAGADLRLHLVF